MYDRTERRGDDDAFDAWTVLLDAVEDPESTLDRGLDHFCKRDLAVTSYTWRVSTESQVSYVCTHLADHRT